jgi:hypothetical protein
MENRQIRPTVVKQVLWLGLVAALVVLAVSACGGGGGSGGSAEEQREEAKARALPEGGPLRPGLYTTKKFEPSLSFDVVGDGWQIEIPEAPDVVDIGRGQEEFGFFNVREVYDPNDFAAIDPAPEDMVVWLQAHPHLEAEKPSQVSVGGVSGQQFDALISDVPSRSHEVCGYRCVLLFPTSPAWDFAPEEGTKYRIIVLEDVGGETVTIAFGGPAVDFEELLPEAQKMLDTVEWKGA